jgi:hypothetical protein
LAQRTRTAAHSRNKMALDTAGGVAMEQARIYRLAINQKIKTSEAARLVYILREVRCSLEAIPPDPEPICQPREIVIRSVPTGYGIDLENPERIVPLLAIEHRADELVEMAEVDSSASEADSSPDLALKIIVGAQTTGAPEDDLDQLSVEQLMQKARELVRQG